MTEQHWHVKWGSAPGGRNYDKRFDATRVVADSGITPNMLIWTDAADTIKLAIRADKLWYAETVNDPADAPAPTGEAPVG